MKRNKINKLIAFVFSIIIVVATIITIMTTIILWLIEKYVIKKIEKNYIAEKLFFLFSLTLFEIRLVFNYK